MGYAFGVEFLELDLGDAREREWHAGQSNQLGLHGAAILSPHPLGRPALIRLESDGDWFDGRHGERRVGGRIANRGGGHERRERCCSFRDRRQASTIAMSISSRDLEPRS